MTRQLLPLFAGFRLEQGHDTISNVKKCALLRAHRTSTLLQKHLGFGVACQAPAVQICVVTVEPANLLPSFALCFFAWRIWRRTRRNIGRQPLLAKRMILRIVIFSALTLVLGAVSIEQTSLLLGLGGGLLVGVPLALLGLRLTRFEATAEGRFFTPNTYLGVAISLLLAGRIIYRLTLFYSMMHAQHNQADLMNMRSALTMFLFGVVAGYYIAYYTGVFLRSHQLVPFGTRSETMPN